MRAGAMCVLAGVLIAACGDGDDGPRLPTGPARPSPSISPGRGLVSLSSPDEECAAKSPVWGFLGPHVLTGATISAAGNDWVARGDGRARGSDFEIRFRLDAGSAQESVTGAMRGTATDLLSTLQFPNPNRVAVAGGNGGAEATLTGATYPQFAGIIGTVTGTLTYTDNQGGVTTCTAGILSLYSAETIPTALRHDLVVGH